MPANRQTIQRFVRATIAWLPLIVLPSLLMALAPPTMPRWVFMWAISAVIFYSFKWLAWHSMAKPESSWPRIVAWWIIWPGMDAGRFLQLNSNPLVAPPGAMHWCKAISITASGAALFCIGEKLLVGGHETAGAWCGLFGMLFLLHFGLFDLMSCAFRAAGVDAQPIMNRPLSARSVGEFWGNRWNRAFRDTAHAALFRPIARRFGVATGTWSVFLFSGIIHEVGISVPAQAGYGLPTLYFVLQTITVLGENAKSRRAGLARWVPRGRVATLAIVFVPVPMLFHPWFLQRVVVPMMRATANWLGVF